MPVSASTPLSQSSNSLRTALYWLSSQSVLSMMRKMCGAVAVGADLDVAVREEVVPQDDRRTRIASFRSPTLWASMSIISRVRQVSPFLTCRPVK